MLTTTFAGLDNRVVIIANEKLSAIPMYNLRRSKDAVVEVVFEIDLNTPTRKLSALKEAIYHYLEEHKYTKSRFDSYLKEVVNKHVPLHVWFQSTYDWQECFPINYVRNDVISFVLMQMEILGISCSVTN